MSEEGADAQTLSDQVTKLSVQGGQIQEDPTGTQPVDSVLSDETLAAFGQGERRKGVKRPRIEEVIAPDPDVLTRERYPGESKRPYLTCKSLHKKKLNIAHTIRRIEADLNQGRPPAETRININIPGRIQHHAGLKTTWFNQTNQTALRLGHLYLDKLREDNITTKNRIKELLDSLKETLEASKFKEIFQSLTENYNKAAAKLPAPGAPPMKRRAPPPRKRLPQNERASTNRLRPTQRLRQVRQQPTDVNILSSIIELLNKRNK
jgi:hypothetical protein